MNSLSVWWRNLSIKYKIATLGLVVIIVFGLAVFMYAMPAVEESYLNKKKEKV